MLLLAAVIGPWLAPQNPYDLMQISIMDAKLSPGSESMSGGIYWLGTDGQGRDMLSAMIYGLRTSLAVGSSAASWRSGSGRRSASSPPITAAVSTR